jgi:hypothetical protein
VRDAPGEDVLISMWTMTVASAAAPEVSLLEAASVGARVEAVASALRGLGAEPVVLEPTAPGALAAGLLERPGLLALLHRAGVDDPLLAGLPAKGPTLVVAGLGDARAAYAFVDGRLWAAAVTLPAASVAPLADPFRADRLAPLHDTVEALCRSLRPTTRDRYANAVAYAGAPCRGGRMAVFLEPTLPEAAVQVVVSP